MPINVNKFSVAQVVPEIYAKNTSFKNSQMCFLLPSALYKSRLIRIFIRIFPSIVEILIFLELCLNFNFSLLLYFKKYQAAFFTQISQTIYSTILFHKIRQKSKNHCVHFLMDVALNRDFLQCAQYAFEVLFFPFFPVFNPDLEMLRKKVSQRFN